MPSDNEGYPSRRDALRLATGGAATLLAGCSGDGGQSTQTTASDTDEPTGSDPTTDTGGGAELVDATYEVTKARLVPENAQFNPYNPKRQPGQMMPQLFDYLGLLSRSSLDFVGTLVTDWEIGDGTLTLTLQSEQTWHDGTEVVAEDVLTKLRLEKHFGGGMWDYVNAVSAPDEKTVELDVKNVNDRILLSSLFTRALRIDTPRFVFGEYLDAIENAEGDDAVEQAKNDLVAFEWTPDEVVGNGPYKLVDANDRRFQAEVHEGHPGFEGRGPSEYYGDGNNFESFELSYWTDDNTALQKVLNGDATVIHHVGSDNLVTNPPDGTGIVPWANGAGYAPTFNFDHELFGKRKFRQAIAYAIDNEPAAKNTTPVTDPVRKPCGVPEAHYAADRLGDESKWLPNIADKLNTYDQDTEKAASLLRELGLSKEDGTWLDPDGEPLSFTLQTSKTGAYKTSAQAVVPQLKRFGLDVELQLNEHGTFFSNLESGNYDFSQALWGPAMAHPLLGFQSMFQTWSNAPSTVEVPMPIGDPDGDLQEMDIESRLSDLPAATGDEAITLVEELAWAANQTLPVIPVTANVVSFHINTADFDWPAEDHPLLSTWFFQYNVLKYGLVQAKS